MKNARSKGSMRSGLAAVTGALIGVVLVAGGAHHLSAQATRADVDGVYFLRRSAVASEEAARISSIRAATARLDGQLQKRWHAVLEISSMPAPKLSIATTRDEIAIAGGDRVALKTPTSGATRPIAENVTVKQQFEARGLVQTISSSALVGLALTKPLQRVSRYRPAQDARMLDVETTISGGALLEPIVFHTTYDRLE